MGQKNYDRLLALPIGTDFKNITEGVLKGAWDAIKENDPEPFGKKNIVSFMRIREARLTEKNLKRLLRTDLITLEMADHIRALPIKKVFKVNQMLCIALTRRIEGKGENAFLPKAGLNYALAESKLPQMPERSAE